MKKRFSTPAVIAPVVLILLAAVLLLPRWLNPELLPIVNAHESVESVAEIIKLQTTMSTLGMQKTVLHGIPKDLLYFEGEGIDLSDVDENNEAIKKAVQEFPEQFAYFCAIDPSDPLRNAAVEDCVADGAVGVKLYNGYSYAHQTAIDDAKLNDFYALLSEKGLLLMLPVNTSEYETELRNMLTLNTDLTVICPHFCLSSKDLIRLSALMTEFPNLYVDTSFGHIDFAKEGFRTISDNRDDYVDFFENFQDRILFGTDAVVTSYEEKTVEWLNALYGDYIAMLTESDVVLASDSERSLQGLDLPLSIQRKVFYQNWMDLTQ